MEALPRMSKRTTILLIVSAITAATITLACGGSVEGSSCKDPGARKTESSQRVYECLPIEPTRPQDGYVWKRVSG